jgi:HlyD family secretion protein
MFRERALERISSPEQLDRLVRITLPRRWLGLGGLLLVVAAVIVWASVSSVPTTLKASGYYIPQGGLRVIQAPTSGTVESYSVAIGDHVVANQPVGVVRGLDGKDAVIRAPETGVITETDALQQTYVNAGDRVALIEPVGWPLVIYAYVPTNIAPGLPPGTLVHVSFGAGIGAAFGYAVGHVESVSQFPATEERLTFILQDPSVVAGVTGQGPSNEVVISLDQSARTASGLVWGSGGGPPGELPAGLPAQVTLIVGSHHPIDDVI